MTRLLRVALIPTIGVLLLAGSTAAAPGQQPSPLPGSSADALKPPLQENQAEGSAGIASANDGPTTPPLDNFNRADGNLCSDPAWSCADPLGGPFTLSVLSMQAGAGFFQNRVSWRQQIYPGDVEIYATIPAKPPDQGAVGLVFNARELLCSCWDAYWLTWDVLAGTDILRIEKIENNGAVGNIVSTSLEMAAGDRFMARRIGNVLQGWVDQGAGWLKVLEGTDPTATPLPPGGSFGLFARSVEGRFDDLGGGAFVPEPPPLEQSTGTCGLGVHAYSRSACREGVNTLTGAYTTHAADLELAGIGVPFVWTRSYTSSDTLLGALGCGWTHGYAARLVDAAPPPLRMGPAALTALGSGDLLLRGEDGQQVLYERQGDGSYVGAAGALSTLAAINGGADGFQLTRHDQAIYRFDANGRLLSINDRNQQGLTFAYDASGQLETITDSVGRQVAVQHAAGRLTRVTLPDGRYVEYGYTDGRLTSVRDARGGITQYTYESVCRVKTAVDQNQKTAVRLDYDPTSQRVTAKYNALNDRSTFTWDAPTSTATLTDARQHQWQDRYVNGLVVERVNPLGQRTQFEYDLNLNVTKLTDARMNATTMTYDGRGNLLTRRAPPPLSYLEEWTYNARNDPLTYKDGRGNVTDYGYGDAGNLTSATGPDADGPGPLGRPQTLYGRDPAGTGLLTSITDPREKVTTLSYSNGNLTEVRTQLGHRTTMGYDGSGRMRSLVDPRGNATGANPADFTWTYTYNEANQLRTQSDPLGNVTELEYDPAGSLGFRKDANLHQTTYGYDDANRLTSVTAPDPDGGGPLTAPVTQYDYDAAGNLETRTDANQRVTTYAYDNANRLGSVTAPLSRLWTYGYDPNGNLTQVTDANGNATPTPGDGQTTYGYGVLNWLTSINYADATPDVTFAYDANGNRTQMTDGSGTETSVYDPLNRLTSVTRGSDAFSYLYDLVNLTQATYPGSFSTTYAYDDDERLQSATSGGQATTYGYDEAANLRTSTLPSGNGYVETRTYDRAGRLVDVENKKGATTLSRFAITPDPVGNPLSVVRTGGLAQTQTYRYDDMDRLTSVCFQAGTCPGASDPFIRWTYDGVGNRLTEARPTGTTTYTYNAADELTLGGSTSYTYDQNGNELSAGSRTFTYDLANRLKTTTLGNTTSSYLYAGDGKRLRASTGPQANKTTNFLWDVNRGLPQLALERNGNNALIRRYTYGTRRISQTAGSNTSYFLHDGLGSTANLTSSSGATQWTWSYEPFGSIRTEQKASGNQPDNFLKFTGEYADATGLYHLRARQYDPQTGRFLSRDPAGGGYTYAGNQPTVFVDPSGQWPEPLETLMRDVESGVRTFGGDVGDAFLKVGGAVDRGSDWLETQVSEHKGGIAVTAALTTAVVVCTAATAGTCAAVVLGGAIAGTTGFFTAAVQGVRGDDLAWAFGVNAFVGGTLGRLAIVDPVLSAAVGGGLTGVGNLISQVSTVGRNVNYCALASASGLGAISAGKGTLLANAARSEADPAAAIVAGKLGSLLPSGVLRPLTAGLGC